MDPDSNGDRGALIETEEGDDTTDTNTTGSSEPRSSSDFEEANRAKRRVLPPTLAAPPTVHSGAPPSPTSHQEQTKSQPVIIERIRQRSRAIWGGKSLPLPSANILSPNDESSSSSSSSTSSTTSSTSAPVVATHTTDPDSSQRGPDAAAESSPKPVVTVAAPAKSTEVPANNERIEDSKSSVPLSPKSPPSNEPTKPAHPEGWLWIRDGGPSRRQPWKKQWFYINGGKLCYSRQKQELRKKKTAGELVPRHPELGSISGSSILSISETTIQDPPNRTAKFGFTIERKRESTSFTRSSSFRVGSFANKSIPNEIATTLLFCAETNETRMEWVVALGNWWLQCQLGDSGAASEQFEDHTQNERERSDDDDDEDEEGAPVMVENEDTDLDSTAAGDKHSTAKPTIPRLPVHPEDEFNTDDDDDEDGDDYDSSLSNEDAPQIANADILAATTTPLFIQPEKQSPVAENAFSLSVNETYFEGAPGRSPSSDNSVSSLSARQPLKIAICKDHLNLAQTSMLLDALSLEDENQIRFSMMAKFGTGGPAEIEWNECAVAVTSVNVALLDQSNDSSIEKLIPFTDIDTLVQTGHQFRQGEIGILSSKVAADTYLLIENEEHRKEFLEYLKDAYQSNVGKCLTHHMVEDAGYYIRKKAYAKPVLPIIVVKPEDLIESCENDRLRVYENVPLRAKLRKLGDARILFSEKLIKTNKRGVEQRRNIVITDAAMYNLGSDFNIKRRVQIVDIEEIRVESLDQSSVLIRVPSEFDLFLKTGRRAELTSALSEAYQELTGQDLAINNWDEIRKGARLASKSISSRHTGAHLSANIQIFKDSLKTALETGDIHSLEGAVNRARKHAHIQQDDDLITRAESQLRAAQKKQDTLAQIQQAFDKRDVTQFQALFNEASRLGTLSDEDLMGVKPLHEKLMILRLIDETMEEAVRSRKFDKLEEAFHDALAFGLSDEVEQSRLKLDKILQTENTHRLIEECIEKRLGAKLRIALKNAQLLGITGTPDIARAMEILPELEKEDKMRRELQIAVDSGDKDEIEAAIDRCRPHQFLRADIESALLEIEKINAAREIGKLMEEAIRIRDKSALSNAMEKARDCGLRLIEEETLLKATYCLDELIKEETSRRQNDIDVQTRGLDSAVRAFLVELTSSSTVSDESLRRVMEAARLKLSELEKNSTGSDSTRPDIRELSVVVQDAVQALQLRQIVMELLRRSSTWMSELLATPTADSTSKGVEPVTGRTRLSTLRTNITQLISSAQELVSHCNQRHGVKYDLWSYCLAGSNAITELSDREDTLISLEAAAQSRDFVTLRGALQHADSLNMGAVPLFSHELQSYREQVEKYDQIQRLRTTILRQITVPPSGAISQKKEIVKTLIQEAESCNELQREVEAARAFVASLEAAESREKRRNQLRALLSGEGSIPTTSVETQENGISKFLQENKDFLSEEDCKFATSAIATLSRIRELKAALKEGLDKSDRFTLKFALGEISTLLSHGEADASVLTGLIGAIQRDDTELSVLLNQSQQRLTELSATQSVRLPHPATLSTTAEQGVPVKKNVTFEIAHPVLARLRALLLRLQEYCRDPKNGIPTLPAPSKPDGNASSQMAPRYLVQDRVPVVDPLLRTLALLFVDQVKRKYFIRERTQWDIFADCPSVYIKNYVAGFKNLSIVRAIPPKTFNRDASILLLQFLLARDIFISCLTSLLQQRQYLLECFESSAALVQEQHVHDLRTAVLPLLSSFKFEFQTKFDSSPDQTSAPSSLPASSSSTEPPSSAPSSSSNPVVASKEAMGASLLKSLQNEARTILCHFYQNTRGESISQDELKKLGDDSLHPHLGKLVRQNFCDALRAVFEQGFKTYRLLGNAQFVWNMIEDVAASLKSSSGDYGGVVLPMAVMTINEKTQKTIPKVSSAQERSFVCALKFCGLVCHALNYNELANIFRTILTSPVLPRYYDPKNAIVLDEPVRNQLLAVMERLSSLPFSLYP